MIREVELGESKGTEFVNSTFEKNPIHKAPYNVVPGMYILSLFAKEFDSLFSNNSSLESISAKFKKILYYGDKIKLLVEPPKLSKTSSLIFPFRVEDDKDEVIEGKAQRSRLLNSLERTTSERFEEIKKAVNIFETADDFYSSISAEKRGESSLKLMLASIVSGLLTEKYEKLLQGKDFFYLKIELSFGQKVAGIADVYGKITKVITKTPRMEALAKDQEKNLLYLESVLVKK